jgi:hypothetical protein
MRTAIAAIFAGFALAVAPGCDGTLTGIARVERAPETPLPPAPEWDGGARGHVNETAEVAASHLLVMFQGSTSAPKSITRTKEQARLRAEEALARIRGGEPFAKVAAAYTDEPGGADRQGRLGRFTRDQMVRPFSEAAFALEVGQVSGIVETQFGFHVIQRTE